MNHVLAARPARKVIAQVLVLDPRFAAEEELDYFFTRSEGQMGLRSNYVDMLTPRAQREPHDVELERRLAAATCHRVVLERLRRLDAMGEAHAGVLQAAYEVRPIPAALQDSLGRLAGIVVRLAAAEGGVVHDRTHRDELEGRAAMVLTRAYRVSGKAALAELRSRATVLYDAAFAAYVGLRGRGPSCAPRSP